MTDANKTVATVNDTQAHMMALAELPRTLMGGTRAMRKAAQKYLPKEAAEEQIDYDNRVKRSTLFNGFRKTVKDMTGKVFVKPVVLKPNVPAELVKFAEDIDLTGRHLNVFARDVFLDGMVTGGGYILTDMPPKVTREDGKPATLEDEQKAGIRPYLVYIPVERLIGWKSTNIGGVETLTQVRIFECVTEAVGEFAEVQIDQIRVIDAGNAAATPPMPGRWRTYRKDAKGDWQLHLQGTYSLPKITLTAFYTNRCGFMTFSPPLEDLADVNVAHWVSQSDQRNILHVARVPILFWAGRQEGDKLIVGANSMMSSSAPEAKLTYVEHTGAAIGAGDKDLLNLEMQMQSLGLQLLIDGPGGQSATGEIRDDAKENSPLAMMARSLGDALEQSFGFMAEYMGLGTDKGGEVEVNKDFGVQLATLAVADLVNMVNAGLITKKTFWSELQRRNVLSESFDPEVETDALAAEAPPLDGAPMDLGKPKPATAGAAA